MLWQSAQVYFFIEIIKGEAAKNGLDFRSAIVQFGTDPAASTKDSRNISGISTGDISTNFAANFGGTPADVVALAGKLLQRYERIRREMVRQNSAVTPQDSDIVDALSEFYLDPATEVENDFSGLRCT